MADEEAGDLALLELGLKRLLALDVEMVGGLVEQIDIRAQELQAQEHQPRPFAVAQHADRLADAREREARLGEQRDRLLLGGAGRTRDIVENRRAERQVAHRLVEVDQPAGRIEADGGLAVVMLLRRVVGGSQRRQQCRLAGAVRAQHRHAITGGHGQAVDGQQFAPAIRHRDVEVREPERHLCIDLAFVQLEAAFARHIGLGAVGLDAGDARFDRVLALVEVGILDRPHLVACRGAFQALDLLGFQAAARRRRGVAAQQFLTRQRKSRLEGMDAVGAQKQRALGHAVEALAVVAHDQHRHLEVDRQPALQRVDVGEVEMVCGLVEDQQVGLLQPRRRRDQHQPLPATRQGAEDLLGDFRRHADLVQQHVDAPVLAAEARALERGAQHLAHRLPGQPLGNVLRQAADTQAARADHLACIEFELAGQALQQRGFSRAVLADQRRARVVEQERHALEDAPCPVVETGILHAQHGLTRRHCCLASLLVRTERRF